MTETMHEFLTTKEIAALLRVRERKVYEMAADGEIPCRRVTGKLLFPRAEIDAWLAGERIEKAVAMPDVVAGSHDLLLDWAIRESEAGLATMFDGSLDGLDRVAARQAIGAGVHVFEPEHGEWNLHSVQERLGQASVVLVEWARRQQGLIVAPDLAAKISSIADVRGTRVALRQPGAGAALLFDYLMQQAGVSAADFTALPDIARTETEAAAAVASGAADVAPGLEAGARQFGLAFVRTKLERYDLVVDRRAWFEPPMQRLVAFARTAGFAAKAEAFGGYDISGFGSVHWNAP